MERSAKAMFGLVDVHASLLSVCVASLICKVLQSSRESATIPMLEQRSPNIPRSHDQSKPSKRSKFSPGWHDIENSTACFFL